MTETLHDRRPYRIPNRFGDPVRRGLVELVRPAMTRMLRLEEINDTYEAAVDASAGSADEVNQRILTVLGVDIALDDAESRRIPVTGPLVVVANHPFGGLEGVALAAMLKRVRGDVKLLANYLLHAMPALRETFIFVDPFGRSESAARNLRGIREAIAWVRGGGVLGVFPAGEVSHATPRRLAVSDPAWSDTVARIVRITKAPVLPVFFEGRNSISFQVAGMIHPRLRTAMLPRELFKRRDHPIKARLGHVVPFADLARFDRDEDLVGCLRVRTYLLRDGAPDKRAARRPLPPGPEPAAVIDPEPPARLADEIGELPPERRLLEKGELAVHFARAAEIPSVLRELGRLRELSFRAVGEGTGKASDIDRFDEHYLHLFLWHAGRREIVGGYRFGPTDEILPRYGVNGLYTSTLFDFRPRLLRQIDPALELGRSFVRVEYQRAFSSLMLLWKGIGRYIARNPRYRMLFGPVSISAEYRSMSKRLLMTFLRSHCYLPSLARLARPRHPVRMRRIHDWDPKHTSIAARDLDEVDALIREIEAGRRSVPVLLRQYLKLNARLIGFNVDPAFGDVVDGLMLVDLTEVDRRILQYYMGREEAGKYLVENGETLKRRNVETAKR